MAEVPEELPPWARALQDDIAASVKTEITKVKTEIAKVKTEIAKVKTDTQEILTSVREDIQKLRTNLAYVELVVGASSLTR